MVLVSTLAYKLSTGNSGFDFKQLNIVVWLFNIVMQCLPMITGDMPGLPERFMGRGICSLGRDHADPGPEWQNPQNENLMWFNVTNTVPLFATFFGSMISSCWVIFVVLPVVRDLDNEQSAAKIYQLVRSVLPYSIGAMVAWTPTLVVSILVWTLVSQENFTLLVELPIVVPNIFFTLFYTLYGLFITVVFFYNSKECRRRNVLYLRKIGLLKASADDEGSSSSSSSSSPTPKPLWKAAGGTDADSLLQFTADFEEDNVYNQLAEPIRESVAGTIQTRASSVSARISSFAGTSTRGSNRTSAGTGGNLTTHSEKSGRISMLSELSEGRSDSSYAERPSGLSFTGRHCRTSSSESSSVFSTGTGGEQSIFGRPSDFIPEEEEEGGPNFAL